MRRKVELILNQPLQTAKFRFISGERKELAARLEALESIVRMLELKHKNSMEHAGRLEEREGELKKEYAKLHERYTELFKTHMDYMERTKLLLSGQQLANERAEVGRLNSNRINVGRSSGPISFGFTSLENAEVVDSVPSSPISSAHSSPRYTVMFKKNNFVVSVNNCSLHSELDNMTTKKGINYVERGQETDSLNLENKSVITSPVSPPGPQPTNNNTGRLHTKKEQRSGNTLYQELSFQVGIVLKLIKITRYLFKQKFKNMHLNGQGKPVLQLLNELYLFANV